MSVAVCISPFTLCPMAITSDSLPSSGSPKRYQSSRASTDKAMAEADYAIIIPAWNEAEFIQEAIRCAQEAMSEVSYIGQLIVVDNNSSDNTAALAEAAGATVVFEAVNQIARARNAGAKAANAQHYVFTDADSVMNPALLTQALELLMTNKAVGGGSVMAPDQPITGSSLRVMTFWNWLSVKRRLAAGCFIFSRADAFKDVGGFSEKVYAGEELLLTKQLKRWAKSHGLSFDIITSAPIITSVRKMQWYSTAQLFRQFVILMIPGAIYSKRLCRTWYDTSTKREK